MWTSPDFTASIKIGSEDDHALLMASIFRTCKHEDLNEFNMFVKEEKKKLKTRKEKEKELLKMDSP